jgi:hypothetical protein
VLEQVMHFGSNVLAHRGTSAYKYSSVQVHHQQTSTPALNYFGIQVLWHATTSASLDAATRISAPFGSVFFLGLPFCLIAWETS